MKAALQFSVKVPDPRNGSIVQMRVWEVPVPVLGSAHRFKYSLYYGRNGVRLVGYDNERGKGDHKHIDGVEYPYEFVSVEKLVSDFLADVEAARRRE
jgi:hypothetical protein